MGRCIDQPASSPVSSISETVAVQLLMMMTLMTLEAHVLHDFAAHILLETGARQTGIRRLTLMCIPSFSQQVHLAQLCRTGAAQAHPDSTLRKSLAIRGLLSLS